MKTIIIVALLIIFLGAGFMTYKMLSWETFASENYKYPAEGYKNANISQILKNPEKFKDQNLMVEGAISNECPTGCWFYVKDQKGNAIKVELGYSNFAIPQRVGKSVKAFGTLMIQENESVIVGKKVLIR